MMWSVIKHRLLEGVYKYVPTTLPFASWKKDKMEKTPGQRTQKHDQTKKRILWRRYVRSKDNSVYVQYKKNRNKIRNKTRLVERKHQNDIAVACKQNSKHFWKYVKSKTTSKEPISDLKQAYADSHGAMSMLHLQMTVKLRHYAISFPVFSIMRMIILSNVQKKL